MNKSFSPRSSTAARSTRLANKNGNLTLRTVYYSAIKIVVSLCMPSDSVSMHLPMFRYSGRCEVVFRGSNCHCGGALRCKTNGKYRKLSSFLPCFLLFFLPSFIRTSKCLFVGSSASLQRPTAVLTGQETGYRSSVMNHLKYFDISRRVGRIKSGETSARREEEGKRSRERGDRSGGGGGDKIVHFLHQAPSNRSTFNR